MVAAGLLDAIFPILVLGTFILLTIIGKIMGKRVERKHAEKTVSMQFARTIQQLREGKKRPKSLPSPKRMPAEEKEKPPSEIERHHLRSEVEQEHLDSTLPKHLLHGELEEHHLHTDITDMRYGAEDIEPVPLAFLNRFPPLPRMVVSYEILSRCFPVRSMRSPFFLHPRGNRLPFLSGPEREA